MLGVVLDSGLRGGHHLEACQHSWALGPTPDLLNQNAQVILLPINMDGRGTGPRLAFLIRACMLSCLGVPLFGTL